MSDQDLVKVFRALLSAGCIEMTKLEPEDFPPRGGYRFEVQASIMLDRSHAESVIATMLGSDIPDWSLKITSIKEDDLIQGTPTDN